MGEVGFHVMFRAKSSDPFFMPLERMYIVPVSAAASRSDTDSLRSGEGRVWRDK